MHSFRVKRFSADFLARSSASVLESGQLLLVALQHLCRTRETEIFDLSEAYVANSSSMTSYSRRIRGQVNASA